MDDLGRMVTVVLQTLPLRLQEGVVTESMVAEALDVFSVDELLRRPESRAALDQIRERLCFALAKELRSKRGPEYETILTGLFACSKCHTTPLLCVVVQESPCSALFQCKLCGYEERKTLLDGEVAEIRYEGSPVDWRGRPLVKKATTRKRKGAADGNRTVERADQKASEQREG